MKTIVRLFFQLIIVLPIMTSCLGTKYLGEDDKLLFKQKINHGKNFDTYTLSELYIKKPNQRFPPYALIYQWGKNKYDSSKFINKRIATTKKYEGKIAATEKENKKRQYRDRLQKKITRIEDKLRYGNTLMQWGEPLAIYDSSLLEQTQRNISNYVFNQGYFNGNVTQEVDFRGRGKFKGRKVAITYDIKEGEPFIIDSLFYRSSDSTILHLLRTTKPLSLIQEGDNYNQSKMVRERERMEFFLKDYGYYNFSRQFIRVELDTSRNENRVDIRVSISSPAKGVHKQFFVDSVNMVISPSYVLPKRRESAQFEEDGIVYSFYENIFSEQMLSRRIHISKDSLYNRSKTLSTQRQLANLDNFKFININYDSSGGRFIANIFTSPLDRYQWSHEAGVNVTQGFPGPFYNLAFKKRNIFRGLENFEVNARYGIEGVASPGAVDGFYENKELGANMSVIIPQFIVPFGLKLSTALGSINPKTRMLTGYTDTDRFDYRRENFNFSNILSWEGINKAFYSFAITNLSIINTVKLSDDFRAILEKQNSRLINSFEPSLVSNVMFTYYKNDIEQNVVPTGISTYYRFQVESGGTFLNFAGANLLERQGLEYFKYFRLDFDYHKSRPLSKVSSIAYRFNFGIAAPYADNKSLPYEKYFFAGGSSGIRAWRPRRLGPGSHAPLNEAGEVEYNIEQQGEMIIQAGIEYRRDLIGFTEYALFIDAGNIWTLYNDQERPGTQWKPGTFLNQIAIGTGIGLRFDFSFLILRFDAGLKTIDPARPAGKRFVLSKGFFDAPFNRKTSELVVFNIGVGYPF